MRLIVFILLSVLDLSLSSESQTGMVIPLVKRTALKDENGVVVIHALRNQITRAANKMERGFQAFRKNTGFTHPSDTRQTVTKRATGQTSLNEANDGALWYSSITVGTPAVKFLGSSDIFLPGSRCSKNCAGHTIYDTNKSSTAKDLNKSFSLKYGDGSSVQGEVFMDTVTIAKLTATNQAVGATTKETAAYDLANFTADGLVGMAFPQISAFHENPVFQTLIAQDKTTASKFSFKLSASGSELFLGGVNNALFKGSLTQLPVLQEGFWEVKLDGFHVAGQTFDVENGVLPAVVDTGTTLVLGDTEGVAKFYSAIPHSVDASSTVGPGFFTFPCDSTPDDVSLIFGGRKFPISPDIFNLGQVSNTSQDCVGGVAFNPSSTDGQSFWVIGDVFLQNVYTVFDVGNTQVGFATLA